MPVIRSKFTTKAKVNKYGTVLPGETLVVSDFDFNSDFSNDPNWEHVEEKTKEETSSAVVEDAQEQFKDSQKKK